MRMSLLASIVAGVICFAAGLSLAQDASGPNGPVVLTITGDVGKTNRGPLDPFADKLIEAHGTRFERAMEFDYAALAALGMHTIKVQYPTWPAAYAFEGPLLKDVLNAAGVANGVLRPIALDGYAIDIPYSDLEKWPVILALKMDGRWLPIGGAGPTWVIYPRDRFPELAKEDDAKWVWGVSHIQATQERDR
jgi:hypothetical protein